MFEQKRKENIKLNCVCAGLPLWPLTRVIIETDRNSNTAWKNWKEMKSLDSSAIVKIKLAFSRVKVKFLAKVFLLKISFSVFHSNWLKEIDECEYFVVENWNYLNSLAEQWATIKHSLEVNIEESRLEVTCSAQFQRNKYWNPFIMPVCCESPMRDHQYHY